MTDDVTKPQTTFHLASDAFNQFEAALNAPLSGNRKLQKLLATAAPWEGATGFDEKLVNSSLHGKPVDIVKALRDLADRYSGNRSEYNLIQAAGNYIEELRQAIRDEASQQHETPTP